MKREDIEVLHGKLRLKHALYARLKLNMPEKPTVAQQNELDDARSAVASLQRIIYWMGTGSDH